MAPVFFCFPFVSGAAQSAIAALLGWFLSSGFSPQESNHHGPIVVLALILGGIIGALLVRQLHHSGAALAVIWTMFALFGSATGALGRAWIVNLESPLTDGSRLIWSGWAAILIVGFSIWFIGIVRNRATTDEKQKKKQHPLRIVSLIGYMCLVFHVIFVGVYDKGTQRLELSYANQIDGRYQTTVWLGTTISQDVRFTNVSGWKGESHRVVLSFGENAITIKGDISRAKTIGYRLPGFEEFKEASRSKTFIADTGPPLWKLTLVCLLLVGIALFFDPLIESPLFGTIGMTTREPVD